MRSNLTRLWTSSVSSPPFSSSMALLTSLTRNTINISTTIMILMRNIISWTWGSWHQKVLRNQGRQLCGPGTRLVSNIQKISNSLESCQARSNMVIFFKRGSSSFIVIYTTIIMLKATHCQSVDVWHLSLWSTPQLRDQIMAPVWWWSVYDDYQVGRIMIIIKSVKRYSWWLSDRLKDHA